jgi:uncharacterized delta-60 repeat protein
MRKNNYSILVLLVAFAMTIACATKAQDGDLDLSFASGGVNILDIDFLDTFQDVIVLADGSIIAAGMSFNSSFVSTAYVVKYTPEGNVDTSFGVNGIFSYSLDFEANIFSCVVRSNGKILLAGSTTDYTDYKILLISLLPSGSLDTPFGTNGVVTQSVGLAANFDEDMAYDMTLDASGKILVSGRSLGTDYLPRPVVLRFLLNGSLDTTFGVNGVAALPVTFGDNSFDCLAVQPDGKIVAAGHYASGLSWFVMLVARFNSNGTLDTTFGTNGIVTYSYGNVDDEAYGLAIKDDGCILVGGFTTTVSYNYSMLMMQFTPSGVLDTNFGSGGVVVSDLGQFDVADDIQILDDGSIVLAGTSGFGPPNAYDMAVWKYNADGTPDTGFGVNGVAVHNVAGHKVMLHGLDIQSDGKIVVSGQARDASNLNHMFVGRLENTVNSEVPGCMDSAACNFDSTATTDDGSCDYSCLGCTDSAACNFSSIATIEDGTCDYSCLVGCTYSEADNYNPQALTDDGSCVFGIVICGEGTIWDENVQQCVEAGCPSDLNDDGIINTSDLLIFLTNFGQTCP